jgi:hypothetical protein
MREAQQDLGKSKNAVKQREVLREAEKEPLGAALRDFATRRKSTGQPDPFEPHNAANIVEWEGSGSNDPFPPPPRKRIKRVNRDSFTDPFADDMVNFVAMIKEADATQGKVERARLDLERERLEMEKREREEERQIRREEREAIEKVELETFKVMMGILSSNKK